MFVYQHASILRLLMDSVRLYLNSKRINRTIFPSTPTHQIVTEQRSEIQTALRSEHEKWTAWASSTPDGEGWYLTDVRIRNKFKGGYWLVVLS